MAGSGGTSIATTAMRALPVGVPKVMASTVGGGDVSAYVGTEDITMMPSVVDVAGINSISRRIYANAAGAIAGMVLQQATHPASPIGARPLITASMFGNTTACVNRARAALEGGGLRGAGLPRHRHRRQDHGVADRQRLHHRQPRHHHHRAGRSRVRRRAERRAGPHDGRGARPASPPCWRPAAWTCATSGASTPCRRSTTSAISTSGTPTSR